MPQILCVTFRTSEPELLIGLLSVWPVEGFEEHDATVTMYLNATDWDSIKDAVLSDTRAIAQLESAEVLPEQNWNAIWEASFNPVVIDDFCAIRASFHPPLGSCRYEIVIDPKMAFGTGHHETTELVIRMMSTLDVAGKSVLDLGCGTGILAILARLMGAAEVTAIDNDPEAIANAIDNATVNHVNIRCVEGTITTATGNPYDILLANIDRNTLLEVIPHIPGVLTPGGHVVLSGILHEDLDHITPVLEHEHFTITRVQSLGEWICLICEF